MNASHNRVKYWPPMPRHASSLTCRQETTIAIRSSFSSVVSHGPYWRAASFSAEDRWDAGIARAGIRRQRAQLGTPPEVPMPSTPRINASQLAGKICSPVPLSFHNSGCIQAGLPGRL